MTCTALELVPYSVFGKQLVTKAFKNRVPISGSIELNFRCNMRCAHCYVAYGHQGVPGKQELTRAEIDDLFAQVTDMGTLWMLLTGGEPLVRPDFTGIYADARQRGLLVTLFTNATLMTERIAGALCERPPYNVEVTLYGATQETYERVTGIPGSYARCMRGIEMLMKHKLPLSLKTIAFSLNRHELGQMQAFAESLGVHFRFDLMLLGGLGDNAAPFSMRNAPEEVARVEMADERHVTGWQAERERLAGAQIDYSRLYQCGAGLTSFHVNPYGELSMCIISRDPGYNLRQGSFKEGWEQALLAERRKTRVQENFAECQDCSLRALCGQCPGWSLLEHGEPDKRVDYLCQVTRARAKRLGFLETQPGANHA